MKKRIILYLLFIFPVCITAPASASEEAFNLSGIIESIINYQNNSDFISDIRNNSKENFFYAMKNLNNGNVIVA